MPSKEPRIKQQDRIIILKKFLSITEQQDIFNQCVEVDMSEPMIKLMSKKKRCIAFHKIKPKRLEDKRYFQWHHDRSYKRQFGGVKKYLETFKRTIRKNIPKLNLDTELKNQIKKFINVRDYSVIGIAYTHNGRISAHKDSWSTMNLTISLGDSCRFDYEENDVIKSCTIDSGDLVLFEGNSIKHGVSKIYLSSAPAWFEHAKTNGLRRFNLQFRLDERDKN